MSVLRPIAGKVKQKLFEKLRNIIVRINGHYKKVEDINISPVFVLGSNRSGTSLVSSILGQHPQLEGVFGPSTEPSLRGKDDKHIMAYCTSHHVWNSMNPRGNWHQKDEGVLWGHPKHISWYYRDKPVNDREALFLANSLKIQTKTNKIPLVNSHLNMFKVGLITEIFPSAKFILIIRDCQDHIRSCSHKWTKQKIDIEFPKIGLHWLTLNTACIYDLKKYAPKNFVILDYASLFQDQKKTNNYFNDKCEQIGLSNFEYNLDIISTKHRYLGEKNITPFQFEFFFGGIDSLLSFEKTITNDLP